MKDILSELPLGLIAFYLAIVGLSIGSFLNVVIYRVPNRLSIIKPGSHCPICKSPIKAWQNIPVISYLILKGKCANCKTAISLRYPLVESLTMVLTLWPLFRFGVSWEALGGILLGWFLLTLAFIDLDTFTLPDHVVLPMGLIGIAFVFLKSGFTGFKIGLLSAIIGAGFLLMLYLMGKYVLRKEALGTGDITMTAAFGFYLHPYTIGIALFAGAFSSLVIAIGWSVIKRKSLNNLQIPFGPALALGAWISYMYGFDILKKYLSMVLA